MIINNKYIRIRKKKLKSIKIKKIVIQKKYKRINLKK